MSFELSNEMFINMKPSQIPKWKQGLSYYEQEIDAIVFWENELRKINEGVFINGYYVHPWLYFHLNFFKSPIPTEKGDVVMNPPLDDNFLYTIETYKEAEYKNKGICMFGCRGFAKSTMLASLAEWSVVRKPDGYANINGGSSDDLKSITDLVRTGIMNLEAPLMISTKEKDWKEGVYFSLVEKGTEYEYQYSSIRIKNANRGNEKSSEKGAGGNASCEIVDEIGKFDPRGLLESALPSWKNQFGMRLVPFLSGCVCKGTKVWNNKGERVNIEHLNHSDGILGFDQFNSKVSKENITYWQPPTQKPCFRIETNYGRILECSDDHPILVRCRYNSGGFVKGKHVFKETKDLVIGDNLCVLKGFTDDLFGENEMFDAYLVGMLIGDGIYSATNSPKVCNADSDVIDYIKGKYNTSTFYTALTKDGRTLEKFTVKGVRHHLAELGIKGQVRDTKRLPKNIHSFTKQTLIDMLSGLYDSDGCIYIGKEKSNLKQEVLIKLTSCGRELLEEVRDVLARLGITAYINYEKLTKNSSVKSTRGHYNLLIKKEENVLRFAKLIPLKIKYKADKLEYITKRLEKRVTVNNTGIDYERIKTIQYIGKKDVYNLTAGSTNTYIANGIITHNTGGNNELSEGAKEILENPEAWSMLPMNWERLDKFTDPEFFNWEKEKKNKFCTFVPGQMSHRLDGVGKKKTNLGKFLGIKGEDIGKIEIAITDWDIATKEISRLLDSATTEKQKNKHRMYFPTSTLDCFLTDIENPFPVQRCIEKLNRIKTNPTYKLGDFVPSSDESGLIFTFSDRKLAEREYKGSPVNAPWMVFGEIPDGKVPKNFFVAGLDDYKLDQSTTTSLGALYILQRKATELGAVVETIRASLATRPEQHPMFHESIERGLSKYNALCNLEAIDTGFKAFLTTTDRNLDMYLCKDLNPAQDLNSKKRQQGRNKYGTYPTPENKRLILNDVINYANRAIDVGIDEEGRKIVKFGVDFIEDPQLLEEMINFEYGGNYDRITAFGHALLLSKEMDKNRIIPENLEDDKDYIKKHNKFNEKPKLKNFSNKYKFNNYNYKRN